MKALVLIALLILTASVSSAEEVRGGLWNFFNANDDAQGNLRIVIDRTPQKPQTMRVYENDHSEPKRFLISTGREDFELPTSPLIDPYCSFTPTGNVFTPQSLSPNHISNTWEDSEMPNSVFFRGGVAMHGTVTPEGNKALGGQASGGCVRLSVADSKTVYDMVQAKGVSNSKGKLSYHNVAIEVIDRRSPEEVQKIEKQCKDTRKFWEETCGQEIKDWRNRCKPTYVKENPIHRTCLKLQREDPQNKNPETPKLCPRTEEYETCLKDFIAHRNKCKGEITKWQKDSANLTSINNTPVPGKEKILAPVPRSFQFAGSQPQAPTSRSANTPAPQSSIAPKSKNKKSISDVDLWMDSLED